MKKVAYDELQVKELLYQALETERGGELVYEKALEAVQEPELKNEWEKYLAETREHQDVLIGVFEALGLDPRATTPGSKIVAEHGKALVKSIELALAKGEPALAQIVAAECVVLAETKDHLNWELIGHVAEEGKGPWTDALKRAFDAVESEEDHHLYHTKGWTRELWIRSLGLPAALPPPEEVKKVETAIGAARAEQARDDYTSAP